MRRPFVLVRVGLAGAAALALLAACGGSDNNASSSRSAPASSSSAGQTSAGSAPAADSTFCRQVGGVLTDLQSVESTLGSDPQAAAQALERAAGQLGSLRAPPEIATEWQQLTSALQQLAKAAQGTDFTDQQSAAQFQQQADQVAAQLAGSATKVEQYLQTQCGISSSGESASSTS